MVNQNEDDVTAAEFAALVGVLDEREPSEHVRGGDWREEAKSRATKLRTRAKSLEIRRAANRTQLKAMVLDPLDKAERLLLDRHSVREWWSGSQVEDCWRLLREAEEGLVAVADGSDIEGQADVVLADVTEILGEGEKHVQAYKKFLDGGGRDGGGSGRRSAAVRDEALKVLAAAHEHLDGHHRAVRQFRNTLILLVVVMIAAAIVLLGAQAWFTSVVFITPPPAADKLEHWQFLVLVFLFGAVGALISAVPSLAQLPKEPKPFNMKGPQAALKIATGAWSAVLGLMAVEAGMATTAAGSATLAGVLFIAAVFGVGQETVTRFADHKASDLLSTDDDKKK